jgi:DNA-binding transcriptional regulator LsrR (DeoR family)
VIRKIGDATGGHVWPIYAPFVVKNPKTAVELRSDHRIKAAMDLYGKVTLGLVVIGSWNPPDSQFYDAVHAYGLAEGMVAKGVVGEVCATLLDAQGRIVPGIEDRTLSVSAEQLRQIPDVIGVAGGPKKFNAVRAALLSGLVTSIVTDAELARMLIV